LTGYQVKILQLQLTEPANATPCNKIIQKPAASDFKTNVSVSDPASGSACNGFSAAATAEPDFF